jgi:hypothetical protein
MQTCAPPILTDKLNEIQTEREQKETERKGGEIREKKNAYSQYN